MRLEGDNVFIVILVKSQGWCLYCSCNILCTAQVKPLQREMLSLCPTLLLVTRGCGHPSDSVEDQGQPQRFIIPLGQPGAIFGRSLCP